MVQTNTESIRLWSCAAQWPYSQSSAGIPLSFDGSGSTNPDGSIVSYAWDFGDTTTGSGPAPSHTYTAAGPYTVSLTVTDDDGLTNTATIDPATGDIIFGDGFEGNP